MLTIFVFLYKDTVRGTKKEKENILCSLRFTFTNEQYVVVAEAHRTFTAEAPDLVDTHSIGTDTRDLPTLINICMKKQHRVSQCKRNLVPAPVFMLFCNSCDLTYGLASVDVDNEARSLVTTQ